MEKINVMLTGAGAPGAPGIIKCLRESKAYSIRVIGVDVKSRVPTVLMLDAFYQVPLATSENFIDEILKVAEQNNVDAIIPLVTRELEVFAQNIHMFADKGIKVCVTNSSNLQLANDKGLLLETLRKHGIETPDFRVAQNLIEFEQSSYELGYPHRAICVKPTKSNGSRGFRAIDPSVDIFDTFLNQKPNSVYTDFESLRGLFRNYSDRMPQMLVMEYLPGDEYSVDLLVENGEVLIAIPRKRLSMSGGISVKCSIEFDSEIEHYCRSVAQTLKLHGNIGIQVRRNREGKAMILEINPRLQGTVVACAAAGANLPLLGLELFLGKELKLPQVKWGIEMIRYWDEVYYDETGFAFAL